MEPLIEEVNKIAEEMTSFRNLYVNKFGEELKKITKKMKWYQEYFDNQEIVIE